jgi:hypothetical protein
VIPPPNPKTKDKATKYLPIILLLPALLCAQEFQFRQEYDTIPVEINGWHPYQPWMGGLSKSNPDFADLDSDGDLDILIGSDYPIIYFANMGNMNSPAFACSLAALGNLMTIGGSAPVLCDIDNDEDLDLFATSDERVWFWENIGTPQAPQFQFITDSLEQITWWAINLDFVDIDDDGDFDLFTGGGGPITFYRNIGTSELFNFVLETMSFAGINVGAHADPCFVDIDADGDLDLFIGNEIGRIYFYRNDGTAQQHNFTFITNYYDSIDVDWYASPEFADIDGDADYDLFVGREQMSTTTSPGDIFFYENVGTPQVAQWNLVTQNYISLDVGYIAYSTTVDIDADSDRDLFIQHTGQQLSCYENTGTQDSASFSWVTDAYQDISVTDASPEFGDLDGDGDPDLLMGEAAIPGPPSIYLFQNRGTPQIASYSLYTNNLIPGVFTQMTVRCAIALADIDADSDLDLFSCSHDRQYYYFQNSGSPSSPIFNQISNNWQDIYGPSTPNNPLLSAFYDIDEDGDLDLFLACWNEMHQMWFLRNVGTAQNAQLVLETQTFLGDSGSVYFNEFDVFDIDNDGDGDFLISTTFGGMVFYRNITGEVSAPPPVERHPQAGLQISLGPNPANPLTVISCQLPVASNISLEVFDISGRKLVELASGFHLPGEYRYVWDASSRAAGMYLIRLWAGESVGVEKIVLLK